jgi:hypothetical protein
VHGAAARRDWWLVGLLCLGTLAYWSVQYQPFVLPNNDYYSFERAAESVASGELPAKFKRGPIFPLLMALLAPAMPEPHPALHAALVLNMAFSLGVLVLLFRLASPLLGAGALLVPVLFATTEQFHAMGLQPLVEPSLGFFCVLTLVLFQARSPWQYAAAAAAALSRTEASTLIPVLFFLNWRTDLSPLNWRCDRRFWKHAALAALASIPFLAWMGVGAMRGSGASSYLRLMEGMGWKFAPGFLVSCYREPFAGWFLAGFDLRPLFLVMAGVPTVAGIVVGLREFRREAIAMLAFLALSVVVIILFGINKSRYVYPTEWIVFFFFATGALRLLEAGFRRLAPWLAPRAELPLLLAVAVLWLAALGLWCRSVGKFSHITPLVADLLYAALALGLVLTLLRVIRQKPLRLWLAASCLFMTVVTPVVVGGIAAKERGLFRIYYANYSSYLLAPWLEENLGPLDRIVLLPRSQMQYLTNLDPQRFQRFRRMQAENAAELAMEMREKGFTHVAYTYRWPARNPAAALYNRKRKYYLAEEFRDGGDVPGFEHVATLPLPVILDRPAVQIYRVNQ